VDAVRTASDPAEIGEPHRVRIADEHGDRFVVSGIDDLVAASSADLALYSELGAPWAAAPTTYELGAPPATTAPREVT
jgi:hypothetical protein